MSPGATNPRRLQAAIVAAAAQPRYTLVELQQAFAAASQKEIENIRSFDDMDGRSDVFLMSNGTSHIAMGQIRAARKRRNMLRFAIGLEEVNPSA